MRLCHVEVCDGIPVRRGDGAEWEGKNKPKQREMSGTARIHRSEVELTSKGLTKAVFLLPPHPRLGDIQHHYHPTFWSGA